MAEKEKTRYNDAELEEFRQIILEVPSGFLFEQRGKVGAVHLQHFGDFIQPDLALCGGLSEAMTNRVPAASSASISESQ